MTLTPAQKDLIRRWILQGATYEGHWAFTAPVQPVVPEETSGWSRGAIDAFVLQRIKQEKWKPANEAVPRTLIRRLTFDLTGLPPTVDQSRDFVRDYEQNGEAAYQNAVTRLLASRHFGERMAVPWMDQARYADTNGYSIDGGRDQWMWRDWVIEAYNQNLPFDQFLTQQIAGDLMPGATDQQKIATGFCRNHMITHEGGTIPEENLTNYVADRVKTTSEVFLGLTMACAQCHDHKYDPISQKEYYQFFAFFNEVGDRGLDGNAGQNSEPTLNTSTVLPTDELDGLQTELADCVSKLASSDDGLDAWIDETTNHERRRGEDFQLHDVKMLDASSPNKPGGYSVLPDGSIELPRPSGGLNAFSHALELPPSKSIDGVRIQFMPYAKDENGQAKLTPFGDGVPKVTTVLISAGDQPAKQVDIYRQVAFSQATASSASDGHAASGVLDERNDQWWRPTDATSPQHLTLTFDTPIDSEKLSYLSVMVFFGVNDSLPHHWKIEAFTGRDTDSTFPDEVAELLSRDGEFSESETRLIRTTFQQRSPTLDRLRVRIANLEDRIAVLTRTHSTMVMNTAPKPRETFVLSRGQYDAPLEKVSPTTLDVLPPIELPNAAPENAKPTRLDLANWMTRPDHPLTARVAVNRIWALFFGRGLAGSSADFGSQGEYPSHPELLDHLATNFVASGWDQKELIRRIVTSATYRQDSSISSDAKRIDPTNRYLARGPRFRLQAEFIRDAALAGSGLLVPRIGGPSVHPYQPPGLWKEVSHFGSTPATKQVYVADRGEKLYRRSLYTIAKRTSPHPSMSAFDAPNREMCIVDRGVTNTPVQALVTLNDPQFVEAARVFASTLLRRTDVRDDEQRLTLAWETFTGRVPTNEELSAAKTLLKSQLRRYRGDIAAAKSLVSVGESPIDCDTGYGEQAAWTQVIALVMNLSETLTRS